MREDDKLLLNGRANPGDWTDLGHDVPLPLLGEKHIPYRAEMGVSAGTTETWFWLGSALVSEVKHFVTHVSSTS